MVRKKITTVNKEIYKEFNNLKFKSCPQIILKNVKFHHVKKIVKDINKNEHILDMEINNNEIIVKKIMPVNFNIYLKKKIDKII